MNCEWEDTKKVKMVVELAAYGVSDDLAIAKHECEGEDDGEAEICSKINGGMIMIVDRNSWTW
jgi:hypothetical protein